MVYKLIFITDLDYVQSIKLLGDGLLSVGRTSCLFNCLYIIFWSLRDDTLSLGCTCPKLYIHSLGPNKIHILFLSQQILNLSRFIENSIKRVSACNKT